MKTNGDSTQIKSTERKYIFPTQARAERVAFDATHMIIYLEDERIIHIPLKWIPSLANADPADLKKVQIGWEGKLIYFDPEDGPINDDLVVASYMRYDEPIR